MDGSSARYTYDATGRKLRAEYLKAGTQDTLRTDYCGNLIYEQGRPKMLLVDGGYVTFNDSLSFGVGFATGFTSSMAGFGASSLNFSPSMTLFSTTATGALTSAALGGSWMNGASIGLNIGFFNDSLSIKGYQYFQFN